jgi:hypothetical protein
LRSAVGVLTREGGVDEERLWVIRASLLIVAGSMAFFLIAPGFLGFPLRPEETVRVVQMIIPVFSAYLATGAAFLLSRTVPEGVAQFDPQLLKIILRGPIYVTVFGLALATAAFWHTNRPSGIVGQGMSLDHYCWWLALLLGLLSVTTSVVVTKLFPSDLKKRVR